MFAAFLDNDRDPVLLQSQFDTLEEPCDAIIVDVSMAPEAIVTLIKARLAI